jgi:hypothetical protein
VKTLAFEPKKPNYKFDRKNGPKGKATIQKTDPKKEEQLPGDTSHKETKRKTPATLIELTEENFLQKMKELGGVNVTTGQLWVFFVSADTKPQQRFPVMLRMARKLEKAGKVKITPHPSKKRQFVISLV